MFAVIKIQKQKKNIINNKHIFVQINIVGNINKYSAKLNFCANLKHRISILNIQYPTQKKHRKKTKK